MTKADLWAGLDLLLPELEELYRDLHAHPELSMQEVRTATEVARRLHLSGWDVTTGVGGTGVVGVLHNGEGPVVMLRADMDALPVREATGLAYASEATGVDYEGRTVPVMHACGHDMHVSCLVGAAAWFAGHTECWRGTLMAVFQPGEETAEGAQAMLDDGFLARFPKPDVVLGQHVDSRPVGTVGVRPGVTMAAAESLRIRLFGRGGHGSRPQSTIDPVVMASAVVLRLQTIVSRETAPADAAVVTVGSIHGGTKENIIPDEAELKVNVRTFSEAVRERVLAAIERVVTAEVAASGAPRDPEISPIHTFPLTCNEPAETARVSAALRDLLGENKVTEIEPKMGSEDFGRFGAAADVPSVFWFLGSTDDEIFNAAESSGRLTEDIPGNHSPRFAPTVASTLAAGVRTLAGAALVYLDPRSE